ncbi:MAG: hypothetical protein AAGD38_17500 [Acidobacteriota bacterium]
MRRLFAFIRMLAIVLVFGALIGFAWLSNNPNAEIVDRAVEWPLVGPLAEAFRDSYRPPSETAVAQERGVGRRLARLIDGEPVRNADGSPSVQVIYQEPDGPIGARETVWVEPGMVLRTEPIETADVVMTLQVIVNLPVLERDGPWFRLRRRKGVEGWAYLPDLPAEGQPLYGSAPALVLPIPGEPPSEEQLASARRHIGDLEEGRVGPHRLLTDVDDPELLAYLDRVASQVETVYKRRFGLQPIDQPRAAVVLFAYNKDYRAFQNETERIRGLPAAGHATAGMLALWRGGHARSLVAATLAHEMVHLINRRAVGPALPPWLDEGMAEAIGTSKINDDGTLDPTAFGGVAVHGGGRVTYAGGQSAVHQLRARLRSGRLVPLDELVRFDWESFVESSDRQIHYAQAGGFVRFLLDSPYADGFRQYLSRVSRGETPDADRLWSTLAAEPEDVQRDFNDWLRSR